jgi:hypothetical protein
VYGLRDAAALPWLATNSTASLLETSRQPDDDIQAHRYVVGSNQLQPEGPMPVSWPWPSSLEVIDVPYRSCRAERGWSHELIEQACSG